VSVTEQVAAAKVIASSRKTVFGNGFEEVIHDIEEGIRGLYLEDDTPWVIGYSGGKDSSTCLQLVWSALAKLPRDQLKKPVHVISTDTMVENPIVSLWVTESLAKIGKAAQEQGLPFEAKQLHPTVEDSFWVNLIGKGYPAPRPRFRWCTERLKIRPSNKFILDVVHNSGEVILVLGTRSAESSVRAANIKKYQNMSTREGLSVHDTLTRAWVLAPIADWSNDDVWQYLMQEKNPWGHDNKNLLSMYQGATADGECPLVVDTSTPSCGDSRFGCYVCTLVEKDKSMEAMIQNDQDKDWLLPLSEFRNRFLEIKDGEKKWDDKHVREFQRMDGSVMAFQGRLIHGPYTQEYRATLLRELLKVHKEVLESQEGDEFIFNVITEAEVQEIRRIWLVEKKEIEDVAAQLYRDVLGLELPPLEEGSSRFFTPAEIELLKEICGETYPEDQNLLSLLRKVLSLEEEAEVKRRRSGLIKDLEDLVKKNAFATSDDALEYVNKRSEATPR